MLDEVSHKCHSEVAVCSAVEAQVFKAEVEVEGVFTQEVQKVVRLITSRDSGIY